MKTFEVWLDALESIDGAQAFYGFQGDGTAIGDDPHQWPQKFFQRCVLRLNYLTPHEISLLGQLRNQYAQQIALWIEHPSPEDLEPLLSLGFKRLPGPTDKGCYGYDLSKYNHKRDWNNPKFWANPERWGKDFW